MLTFLSNPQVILGIGSPLLAGSIFYYNYNKRRKALQHPVMRHSLDVLSRDSRILNYCGDDPRPGFFIKKREKLEDNWTSFEFKMKGSLGTLKCTLVGDFLAHAQLQKLNEKQKKAQELIANSKDKEELAKIKEEYIPTDFTDYIIPDQELIEQAPQELRNAVSLITMIREIKKEEIQNKLKQELLKPGDKIWRISSLNAMHDTDSKLRLRPTPTSDKKLRPIETQYQNTTLYHLFSNFIDQVEKVAGETSTRTILHKYEDLTEEEKKEVSKQKNKKRFQRLFRVRFYQIFFLSSALVLYILVGRKFYPKPVFRSVPYKQALDYMENNPTLRSMLPSSGITILNCEGRINQFSSKLKFQLLLPSKEGLMKVFVRSELKNKRWVMKKISLITEKQTVGLLDI